MIGMELTTKRLLIVSQVRLDSIEKIPGKAFQEAKNWSKYFNLVVFLCFSEDGKYHFKKYSRSLLVIAIPFNISKSVVKTVISLAKNYVRLLYYQIYLVRLFKFDLIREENLIICGFPTFLTSKLTRVPFITWLGGFERYAMELIYGSNMATAFLKNLVISLEFIIFKNSRMVFTVSQELFDLIGGVHGSNRFLSPNFVDLSIFQEKKYPVFEKGRKFVLFYSGRFEKEKGIDNLLAAINILAQKRDDFVLKIAGYGTLESEMRKFSQDHDLARFIEFCGKFPLSELPPLYQQADIFLIPSHTEGLPAALLEAMSSGCACVCTNVGMISQYIKDNYNGYLVVPNDYQDFANAIEKLLNQPTNIIEFGKINRKIIETQSGKYINIHKTIYKKIINQKL